LFSVGVSDFDLTGSLSRTLGPVLILVLDPDHSAASVLFLPMDSLVFARAW
jgi:hypothetical protein